MNMDDVLVHVDKRLSKLEDISSPIEMLVLADIMEHGDLHSNRQMAEFFRVSEATIGATLRKLEQKGYITKHTYQNGFGIKRSIILHQDFLNSKLDKITLDLE